MLKDKNFILQNFDVCETCPKVFVEKFLNFIINAFIEEWCYSHVAVQLDQKLPLFTRRDHPFWLRLHQLIAPIFDVSPGRNHWPIHLVDCGLGFWTFNRCKGGSFYPSSPVYKYGRNWSASPRLTLLLCECSSRYTRPKRRARSLL